MATWGNLRSYTWGALLAYTWGNLPDGITSASQGTTSTVGTAARRGAALRVRRGRFVVVPAQGPLGVAYPSITEQPGGRPRWAPRPRRGRSFEPCWPQGTQGSAFPQMLEQAGNRPRWLPRVHRGRRFDPAWPAVPPGGWIPPMTVGRRPAPRSNRHLGIVTAPTSTAVQVCVITRPNTGVIGRPTVGTTIRPDTGIIVDPC